VRKDILEQAAIDLLSIPPLVFRQIRRKLIKTTLADIDAGITLHHVEIIRLLDKEGELHVAEIGDRLQIARAQMTALLDKLVCLKLVDRRPDAADRRTIVVSLSAYGRTVWQEHRAGLINAMQEIMQQLSEEELKDLSDTLRRLQGILSKLH
jgi:DNA-binding MarR family transcriptional regulator